MNDNEQAMALVSEFTLADLYIMAKEAETEYNSAKDDLEKNYWVIAATSGEINRAREEVNKLRRYSELLQKAYMEKRAIQKNRAREIIDKVPTL